MHSFDDFRAIVTTDEPLAPHTWFRLGGPASLLARPRDTTEVVGLIRRCRDAGVPFRVLGGGSNVLVRDEGFPGLVIHLESPAFADVTITEGKVEAGAAVPLTALISQTARAGLAGLEVLTGIPGTVGGSLRNNSGGRQGAIGTFVRRVTVVDDDGEVLVREREDLSFDYRSSDLDEPIILSAGFELESEDPEAVVRRMRRIWIIKKENQPYGHQSSGCIFKNPTPEVSAGALVERAGMKGQKIGGAEVSDRHANFIVAHPGARSAEVLQLIDVVREKVLQQFGYELELQIKIW
jgi:UDP-N-acetylmuramate dehydrogenase